MAAAVYVLVGLLLYFRQGAYIYLPARTLRQTPAAIGLAYEDIRLKTEDGATIAAWFIPADTESNAENRPVVLFCHGNAGNIGDRLNTIRTFVSLGLDVLIFDYHGYGESEGKPGENETYLAALAAWEHLTLTRGVPPNRIVVFGRSLGGGVASWLARRCDPGLLVLESAFESVPAMARKIYPIYPVRLLSRFSYDTLARMEHIRCPVIVAHSRDDEMIPFEQGRRIFEAANEPKTFIELQGSHNAGGIDITPGYRALFREWVDTHIALGEPDNRPDATKARGSEVSQAPEQAQMFRA